MKIEPILFWLVGLMVFFSMMTLFVAIRLSSDGQTFQVMSGCLLTVLGYFGGLIKGRIEPHVPPPPGGTISTVTVEKAETPAQEKPATPIASC